MTDDLYCSTDGCGNFENNISKILSDISVLQNKDLDQDARLEALEMLDISEVITKSNNALLVANAIDAKATLALSIASTADGKVDGAVTNAGNAVIVAGDALSDAADAFNKAVEAYNEATTAVNVSGYANDKATTALSNSETAIINSATAVVTANEALQAITFEFATEAEAIGGTDNTTLMSPLRVDQAFSEKFKVIDGVLNVFENGEWVEYVPK